MRQIKFRGRVPDSDKVDGGRIVYGYLVIYDDGIYTHWLYRPNEERNCPVVPESVQQLIAVDKNGREIYEGDKILFVDQLDKTKPLTAIFTYAEAITDGYAILAEATS